MTLTCPNAPTSPATASDSVGWDDLGGVYCAETTASPPLVFTAAIGYCAVSVELNGDTGDAVPEYELLVDYVDHASVLHGLGIADGVDWAAAFGTNNPLVGQSASVVSGDTTVTMTILPTSNNLIVSPPAGGTVGRLLDGDGLPAGFLLEFDKPAQKVRFITNHPCSSAIEVGTLEAIDVTIDTAGSGVCC